MSGGVRRAETEAATTTAASDKLITWIAALGYFGLCGLLLYGLN